MLKPTRFTLSRLAARETRPDKHPDTDLLQAFRERNLTAKERSALMSHLSRCSECREVLSLLAQSPDGIGASVTQASRSFANAWSKRRWVAAALAVACLVLVFRSWRNPISPARNTVLLPVIAPSVPPPSMSALHVVNETNESKESLKKPPKPQARARAPLPKIASPPLITSQPLNAPVTGELELLSRASALQLKKTSDLELQSYRTADQAATVETHETGLRDLSSPAGVKLEASRTAKAEKLIPSVGGLYSFAPAPQSAFHNSFKAKAIPAPPIAARWSLTGSDEEVDEKRGTVYRSQDEGRTWTAFQVAPGTPLTALAAVGPDIWAGGARGVLYHSPDDGRHWAAIAVADEQERLTSPITGIEIPESGHIILKVHSGRDWMTVDSGQHWSLR